VILRLTAGPAPQSIQYSDLIDHIHARTVTSALFEEGSQRLLFNVQAVVNEPESRTLVVELPGATTEESRSAEQVGGAEASSSGNSEKAKVQPQGEWQYVTRRVRNDEAYLLGLMREKGVRYSSAPQSVSASLRSLLFTVISLWLPLSPLLWLLHRQISGNNSSTQRRRSNSRLVNFTDVAGIDTAKAELAEVLQGRHPNLCGFDTIF
jgi:ATP-dependent Zn protease